MSKRKYSPRLVVVRTAPIETLLQELWAQQPEIRGKISVTVALSVAALIRENEERKQRNPSENALTSPVATPYEAPPVKKSAPHPDSIWG